MQFTSSNVPYKHKKQLVSRSSTAINMNKSYETQQWANIVPEHCATVFENMLPNAAADMHMFFCGDKHLIEEPNTGLCIKIW